MTNNKEAGKTVAEVMLQALKDAGIQQGTIGIFVNELNTQSTIWRDRGFRESFEGTHFIIEPTVAMQNDPQVAKEEIKAHPEYVGFFCANQKSTIAAGEQLKESGSKQIVIGFETAEETLDMIKDGVIYATMKQNTKTMGYDGIKFAVDALKGKLSENGIVEDTGVTVITKNNLDQAK